MCNCVIEINKKLLQAGHNTRIKTPLILNDDLGLKIQVVTEKVDSTNKKKPVSVFTSYCPFCGKKQ